MKTAIGEPICSSILPVHLYSFPPSSSPPPSPPPSIAFFLFLHAFSFFPTCPLPSSFPSNLLLRLQRVPLQLTCKWPPLQKKLLHGLSPSLSRQDVVIWGVSIDTFSRMVSLFNKFLNSLRSKLSFSLILTYTSYMQSTCLSRGIQPSI